MTKPLATRLAGIAERIAVDDVFTVKKPIRFKPEGSTMYSLVNARMIRDAGYNFIRAYM